MKIGIIGAGGIGTLYARLWHAAGHEIRISSRSPAKLDAFVAEFTSGMFAGTPAEAAAFGDVVLLAPNYETVNAAVDAIRPHVGGKLVIDATNPLRLTEDGELQRLIPDDAVAGVVMARMLPEARIAKTLTSLWTGHVERLASRSAPEVAMPLAADAAADRDLVAGLVRDAGLVPVDLGTLAHSRPLDPGSPVWNVVLTSAELQACVDAYRLARATA